ncbi:MAG TPA: 4Fe-4S dicluster domain-containing protein [Candidatus Marinimicrobia bacterium]|nr:4Fe-4S dicluster domain-containing protein [Candidatus Neomarinimicrobiota bacterium]
MNRRNFVSLLSQLLVFLPFGGTFGAFLKSADKSLTAEAVTGQRYAMGIQISECIGCGRCVVACKTENNVPRKPFFFRTWVERYIIKKDDEVIVQSKDGGVGAFTETVKEKDILRSFFVPKLCNHCDNPPCAQVCPVGATFQTVEGIVLVDENRCIGCSYCIQACPYGARYMHPEKHTADKCTLCYHRIKKGMLPACVEVCPMQARVFGDLNSGASPLARLKRMKNISVLKPGLNTKPKVFYTDLDGEVR